MSKLQILLLAAGDSKRMGSPKQLLPWGSQTLIEHQIKVLLATGLSVAVVLGANAEKINKLIEELPIAVYKNKSWQKGMGSSLAYGLKKVLEQNQDLEGLLICLADQPLITTVYLKNIVNFFQKGTAQIIASKSKEQWEGAPVLFDKVYFDELLKFEGDKGAKHLLEKHRSSVKLIMGEGVLKDMDTVETYRQLLNRFKKPH